LLRTKINEKPMKPITGASAHAHHEQAAEEQRKPSN